MAPTLPAALASDRISIDGPVGAVNVYASGNGPPLLLVHSINAAASAAEVRPLQEYYRGKRRVYCVDLPGFGLSDRPDVAYSPRLMTDALHAVIGLIQREGGPRPIDALALSLSCEYLARAAVESSSAFASLALVSPTGFRGNAVRRGLPGSDRGRPLMYRSLRGPGWGRWLYEQLTRPSVIRYFLRRTWGSKDIDDALWWYDVVTARQLGGEHAPLRFLSGYLFSGDIHTVYESLRTPTWMSHGVRGDFTDYRNTRLVADRANWYFSVFETGALPYFEVLGEFLGVYDKFLADHPVST